jgi:hypothetical protein
MNPDPAQRMLPANLRAERTTLGALLMDREAILAVAPFLKPEHFYLEKHAWIYEACLACLKARTPPDVQTVSEELRRVGRLDDVGGVLTLIEMTNETPTAVHIAYYAQAVERAAVRRRLIEAGAKIAALGYDEAVDLEDTLAKARLTLDSCAVHQGDLRYQTLWLEQLLAKEMSPVLWAVPNLLPEGLTILAGKPKMKKSWLALAFGIAIVSAGQVLGQMPATAGVVLYLCLEDGERRLRNRALKLLNDAGVPSERFGLATKWPRFNAGGLARLETWLQQQPQTRLIIIDTLAKVRPQQTGRSNPYEDDYTAVEDLKQLADRYHVSILLVHHMNKRGEADDPLDLISGTTGLPGGVDGVLLLQKDRTRADAVLHVIGRDLEEDQELALQWDHLTAQWVLMGKAEEYRTTQERQAILDVLRDAGSPLTIREITDGLPEGEYQNVKQLVYKLLKDNLLVRVGGRYTLAPEKGIEGIGDEAADPLCDPLGFGHQDGPNPQKGIEGIAHVQESLEIHADNRSPRSPFLDIRQQDGENDGDRKGDRPFSERSPRSPFGHLPPELAAVLEQIDVVYAQRAVARKDWQALRTHCVLRKVDMDLVLAALDRLEGEAA